MLAVCMALIDDEEDKNAFEMLYKNYRNLRPQILYNFFWRIGRRNTISF